MKLVIAYVCITELSLSSHFDTVLGSFCKYVPKFVPEEDVLFVEHSSVVFVNV